MFEIVSKKQFSEKVYQLVVKAPLIAKVRKAGNFVIVRADEKGERVPLTIAEADVDKGTITLVMQRVGVSTEKLCSKEVGECLADVVGPLGQPTHIENFGTVVCAGGGVGVAPMLPIIQALKKAGNKVISILAGRSKDLIILEDEVKKSSDEVIIMTDDGSYGEKGLVTNGIEKIIQREKVDKCFAIGPAIMMKFVCLLTKKYNISTEVSLNTIMVDGTGMCGACRVSVGGQMKFVCVDGPEFDGHQVDFDEMMKRQKAFSEIEKNDFVKYQASLDPESMDDEGRDAEWRVILRKSMTAKERAALQRVKMPELNAKYRAGKLKEEVNLGISLEQAMNEAKRCLDCVTPGCIEGCPVGIDIPRFIKHIEKGEIDAAASAIKEYSALPAVCGRVCPQEKQCEAKCIHLKMKDESVAIGYLERFAADWQNAHLEDAVKTTCASVVKKYMKVAVVGSGPAGLAFAGDMIKRGYDVTVFEALHEIGGVLKYGIPEYRLPNQTVDAEIAGLKNLGVNFVKDCIIGKTISIDQLKEDGFKGVFVASGAGLPNFMNIPGENLINILSSNEYLTRVNLMDASNGLTDTPVPYGKHVAVIGGGNTAMDSVRTALRLGAESATIIYRRSEEEMPARAEEVKHAKEEGVIFYTLHNPVEYRGDELGHVKEVVVQKMELGEPDASGRRRPLPIEGAIDVIPVDLVIVSIGVSPNPIVPHSVKGLELGKKGTIEVNDKMQSSIPMIFAGGDIVRGGATVILAMGDGRKAAASMDEYLSK